MASQLTLYRVNGSCSMVPHSLLTHLGIPFSSVLMDWNSEGKIEGADGNLSNEEYRRTVNPAGFVPCLVVNGTSITEMPAVLTYIVSLAPDTHLLGREGVERAKIYEWISWLSNTVHGYGFGTLMRPQRFSDDESDHDAIRAKGRKVIESCYERIESRLVGLLHPVGDDFTVVDFNLYVFRRWGDEQGFDMSRYPNYNRVLRHVESLEGIRKAVEVEGRRLYFPADNPEL